MNGSFLSPPDRKQTIRNRPLVAFQTMDCTMPFCVVLRLVFPLRRPLPQAAPTQRRFASFGAQAGVSRGAIGFADARNAPLDTPSCAERIVERLQGKRSDALNRSKCFGFCHA